jgi:neutral ceramidase
MALRAGFAEVDITPPVGTQIIGWLAVVVSQRVLDPLYARAAVFETDTGRIGFIQLDTLSIRWRQVQAIREQISAQFGFPGDNVMIAATHNHAGPAVMHCGDARRDDAYLETLTEKVVGAFGRALESLQEAQIGFGSLNEFDLSYNRRVIMRDGTVQCQRSFDDPNALCLEGPIDPEVAVLAARRPDGEWLGCLINFACHPTHHGSDGALSAGFPGALAQQMKARGCPITLFLNGAAGNIIFFDVTHHMRGHTKEEMGARLAEDAATVMGSMSFRRFARAASLAQTISLPFRHLTEEEIRGTVRGAQRFVDPAIYDREIPRVVARIQARGQEKAQVQALALDEITFVAVPAEYFVEFGLRLKEQGYPRRILLVTHANGMVGYVPHREAFLRGGYETTFAGSSRLAPEAGDLIAECALALTRQLS